MAADSAPGAWPQGWDPGTLLPHLAGGSSAVRQAMAAHALAGLDHIVEIGGAGLPITGFLRHTPRSVTVVDPKIEPYEAAELNGAPCRVRHIARKFREADASPPDGSLGVILLGLSLKPLGAGEVVGAPLVALCAAADLVVIEHATGLARAIDQAPLLVAGARLTEIWGIEFTLRDSAIAGSGHEQRRLSVLRPLARAG